MRSFGDSNGDGIGDLAGITERLPYISSLGVEAIWLNPCYPSPQRDHGYDVSDYFDIEPAYGSLATFDVFVEAAHAHNIRVLMDVVPNHCSKKHPWFQAALSAGPGSDERARFWFRPGKGPAGDEPPNNWQAIFGGSAWTRVTEADGTAGEWYLGVFTPDQPDWNFTHPAVVEHFDQMLCFWFDRGVDGFRADAVIYLGKVDGLPDAVGDDVNASLNPMYTYVPSQHESWRHWRDVVNQYEREHQRDLLLVAEAYTPNRPDRMVEYANNEEFHQSFAFDLMLAPWRANVLRPIIDDTLAALAPSGQLPAWTLNNHDAQRSATRYGRADAADREHLPELAITNSTAPVDGELGLRRARAAALLSMGLPGCVYLYAGEELGLPEVLELPDRVRQDPLFFNSNGEVPGRDGCRIPLPWSANPDGSFGFSPAGTTTESWLPQPSGWGSCSVETQSADEASTLSLYRCAGQLRREHVGLRSDHFAWIDDVAQDLVAFRRDDVIVACNPTMETFALSSELVGGHRVALSSLHGHTNPTVVPPNTTLWITPE